MELTAHNVTTIFQDCLVEKQYIEEENPAPPSEGQTVVNAILHRFYLNTETLKKHQNDIADMLSQLPDEFQKSKRGGWSFLNSCDDRTGRQWADLHSTMEELWSLGIATGAARYLLPRELWPSLHAGMPYLEVTTAP